MIVVLADNVSGCSNCMPYQLEIIAMFVRALVSASMWSDWCVCVCAPIGVKQDRREGNQDADSSETPLRSVSCKAPANPTSDH